MSSDLILIFSASPGLPKKSVHFFTQINLMIKIEPKNFTECIFYINNRFSMREILFPKKNSDFFPASI